MQRLIKDAAALDSSIDANSMSFANIVKAINVVQTKMGITGTTALEAGRTISGSIGSMKAAWTNLVTGFADGNADIEGLIENLVTTIVGDGTENNLGVIGNLLPAIERALGGIGKLIEGAVSKLAQTLPGLIQSLLPSLISAATGLVNSIASVLPSLINTIVTALSKNAPALVKGAGALIKSLLKGIKDNAKTIVDALVEVVYVIVDFLKDKENLVLLVETAIEVVLALANGIIESLDVLIPAVVDAVIFLCNELTKPENIKRLLYAAFLIVGALSEGLIEATPELLRGVGQIASNILSPIAELGSKLWEIGTNLMSGLWEGMKSKWRDLKDWFTESIDNLIVWAKDILGIASPSKAFKKLGGFTAEGFGIGFEDEFAQVKDDMEDALNFDDANVGINASIRKVGAGAAGGAFGGTSIGNININIDGAKYSDEQSLASAIAIEIQNMTDRRAAVYA